MKAKPEKKEQKEQPAKKTEQPAAEPVKNEQKAGEAVKKETAAEAGKQVKQQAWAEAAIQVKKQAGAEATKQAEAEAANQVKKQAEAEAQPVKTAPDVAPKGSKSSRAEVARPAITLYTCLLLLCFYGSYVDCVFYLWVEFPWVLCLLMFSLRA